MFCKYELWHGILSIFVSADNVSKCHIVHVMCYIFHSLLLMYIKNTCTVCLLSLYNSLFKYGHNSTKL